MNASPKDQQQVLNELGKSGWRLIDTHQRDGNTIIWYLERELNA